MGETREIIDQGSVREINDNDWSTEVIMTGGEGVRTGLRAEFGHDGGSPTDEIVGTETYPPQPSPQTSPDRSGRT